MADKLLLGVADQTMKDNDDAICSWSTNKFGGNPNWMHGPPEEIPSCLMCGNLLSLVSQVYCPLHDSHYHRVLYLFACVNPGCWNQNRSWKVLRSQTIDVSCCSQQLDITETFDNFDSEDWCDDSEDWGETDSTMAEIEGFIGRMTLKGDNAGSDLTSDQESHAELASSTAPLQSIVTGQHFTATCFTPYYVSVFEQPYQNVPVSHMSLHERELLTEYEKQQGARLKDMVQTVGCSSNVLAGEAYEKTSLKHGDQAFYKFHKELQYYPQQCLRYMWNGKPLTISGKDASELKGNVPNCQYCGRERVYELQLMPALVHLLRGPKSKQKSSQASHNSKFEKENIYAVAHDIVGGKSPDVSTCSESKDEDDTGFQGHNSLGLVSKRPSVPGSTVCSTSDVTESVSLTMTGGSKGGLKGLESQGLDMDVSASPSDIVAIIAEEPSLVSSKELLGALTSNGEVTVEFGDSKGGSKGLESQGLNMDPSASPSDVVAIIAEEPSLAPSKELLGVLTSNGEVTVEFGTAIVYTCAKSCWTESSGSEVYREEFILVEPDPDSLLFK